MTTDGSAGPVLDTRDGGLAVGAIDHVAFLARSEHRLRVLELLAGESRPREYLRDRLDATRVTLSRVLNDLEERGFIERTYADDGYELSTFGELVYRDFDRLLETVSVGAAYPELLSRLPTDWFDFDLGCLVEGEHVHGRSADPLAAARVVADAITESPTRAALVETFTSLPMYAHEAEAQAESGTDAHVVLDADVTETVLAEPSLRARWQAIEATAESPVYYTVEERIPATVDLVDGTVFLTIDRKQAAGFDVISCSHPDVLAWADRVTGEYRDRAVPLAERAEGTN